MVEKTQLEKKDIESTLKEIKGWRDVVRRAGEMEREGNKVDAANLYNAAMKKFPKNKNIFAEHLVKLIRRADVSESQNLLHGKR